MGHAARVLGPCDGPPPDIGVTPLGDCVPLAANGSVAPVAPDASCALRTIRALRDEEFDVLHVHEPLVPGPTMTALVAAATPMVGTFHAAGGSAAYRWLFPIARWMAGRLSIRCAVSEDARDMARRALGGEYELLHNGIGVVLLEAMAAETPIVASDLPGYRNVARAGQDALLAHPGDPKALADALVAVLEHPTLAESLVASGDARAAEFSMDLLAERYLDL